MDGVNIASEGRTPSPSGTAALSAADSKIDFYRGASGRNRCRRHAVGVPISFRGRRRFLLTYPTEPGGRLCSRRQDSPFGNDEDHDVCTPPVEFVETGFAVVGWDNSSRTFRRLRPRQSSCACSSASRLWASSRVSARHLADGRIRRAIPARHLRSQRGPFF